MTTKETLEVFASNFVLKNYRSRCVHDALKKPEKLMQKVCHNTSEIFSKSFLNCYIEFNEQDKCLFYGLSSYMEETTWNDAINVIKKYGGGGYLIIDINGNKFYAESEGEPSLEIYSGTTNKTQEPIFNPIAG